MAVAMACVRCTWRARAAVAGAPCTCLGAPAACCCLRLPPAPPLLPAMPRSEKSFARAQHWVAELQRNAGHRPLLVLVGNKTDLPAEERAVPCEAAAALAERCASRGCPAAAAGPGLGSGLVCPMPAGARGVARGCRCASCHATLHGGLVDVPSSLDACCFPPCSNGMLYIETSAKTGSNVEALFQQIAEGIAAPAPP